MEGAKMAGTYSQLYIHIVFAVKGRQNLLGKDWRETLFKYIAGIINAKKQKSIIVNGMADHVHIFVGLNPSMKISDLVRDIKNNSSRFINEQHFLRGRFSWQEGYGVFSYGHSQIEKVFQYIKNQEQHHHKRTFREEYFELLTKFNVRYDERYLFEWIE